MMIEGLKGIFNLILFIVGMIIFVRTSHRRVKRVLKANPAQWSPSVPSGRKTNDPQLLKQILLTLPGVNHEILENISIVATEGITIEVDLLMICPGGFYLFYAKKDEGRVTGSDTSRMWRITRPDGSVLDIQNPIQKNQKGIEALCRRHFEFREEWFSNYIVFSNQCVLSSIENNQPKTVVLNRRALFEALRKYLGEQPVILSPEKIRNYASCLKPYTERDQLETRRPVMMNQIIMPKPIPNRPLSTNVVSQKTVHEIKTPDLSYFSEEDRALKNKLVALCQVEGQKTGVSPEEILNQNLIGALINMKPQTLLELGTIGGLSDSISEKYGHKIVSLIQKHYGVDSQ